MAVSDLSTLHPYLYRRVWLKGLLFSLLGFTQIFSSYVNNLLHVESANRSILTPIVSGSIFLVIGLGIFIGLYIGKDNYRTISRKFLYAAFIYAAFWELVLLSLVIKQNISTSTIFILWGYLTYNLQLVARDSAWDGAEIVREIRENGSI